MKTNISKLIKFCFAFGFTQISAYADDLPEINIGKPTSHVFGTQNAEHFSYEGRRQESPSLVTRLSKNGKVYEMLNFGRTKYSIVINNNGVREDLLTFRVYDGPIHWLVDIKVSKERIMLATATPGMAYSVYSFEKKGSIFEEEMFAHVIFPIGMRGEKSEPKLQSLTLGESYSLTASFIDGKSIVYRFPKGGQKVIVGEGNTESDAGRLLWSSNGKDK